ncbi:MAG: hypothetical protein JW929_09790 [Anaerolineales bacterium]|nr:hypothetical protein [Anaerolineales bacterium]
MTIEQTQRPRFYPGQYLGSEDLSDALEYSRLQAARHALGAHTWGIAIGLGLREVPAIGMASKVSMVIDPGYAWDGFGRPIVVLEPYKIPEALFDSIKYDPVLDAPGKGRLTEVWLRYHETKTQKPPPGFEPCDAEDTYCRIQESFLVDIGCKLAHSEDHDPVTVDGKSGDAMKALQLFDSRAPAVYDESIPQQVFPQNGDAVFWFVPLGYVRWLPAASGAGQFVALSDNDKAKGRRFRRHIGVVAENIEAAGGAIRLRDRTADPAASKYTVTDDELVDVEGSTRVEGDVNIAGGALNFRHADGTDKGTALRVQRAGDGTTAAGGRTLGVGIGPDTQTDNRLSIGPLTIDTSKDPDEYTLAPKVTVVSDGKVGVGTTAPNRLVTLQGDTGTYLNIKADGGSEEVLLGADSAGGIVSAMTDHDLQLRAGGNSTKVTIKSDGKVGIGTGSPNRLLTLQGGAGTYLNVKADGGGEEVLLGADSAGGIVSAMTDHDLQLRAGSNSTKMTIKKDGKVGVGTTTPEQQLHVVGGRIRLGDSGGTKRLDLRADGSAVDLWTDTHPLYIRSGTNPITLNPGGSEGGVGVGTNTPQCKLHVTKSVSGAESDETSHVALIENTATDNNADVLALKVGVVNPGINNNFLTCFDGGTALGGIDCDPPYGPYPHSSIYFSSHAADYAESLPRADETEAFEPGDVIGVVDGKVIRRTSGAHHVGVVSAHPVVLANSPRPGDPRTFEKVAFLGQVYVKVCGPVRAGDCIVPSGADDGIGIAVPADKLTPQQAGQIVGQAWENSKTGEIRRVLVAVGLPTAPSAALAALVQNQGRQIEELREEIQRLKKTPDR